jgi:hypothetical protein
MASETLSKASNIVFIVTCAALIGLASVRVWDDHRMITPSANEPMAQEQPLPRGTTLPHIEGVSFDSTNATVALVLQSQCKFCAASIPFYKRLADLRAKDQVQIVVFSKEPADVMRSYVRDHGLEVDSVAVVQDDQIQTPGTPTLLVVTKHGAVEASWIGQLSSAQEQEVLRQVNAVARRSS